ncbi:MAG: Septum site-determining protein MinD [Syntrophorhabdaceae bacterium PtaU1.Bin034]|nr:MAG: Septum site-determining protein MinD [Syntrophorhabdaceae bacterium PtaU1.Bin034]
MKEVVVLSGKGGTGKTSLVAGLAFLLSRNVVADCDVDAANLNLLLNSKIVEEHEFYGGRKATIRTDLCTGCGRCREVCRFDAISENYVVDPLSCEGCGACHFLCPAKAVLFDEALSGHYYVAQTKRKRGMVYAELLPGAENSGKLVSVVRTRARDLAESDGNDLVLIDGPPGIGCPVISSLTGTQLAVFVTEPTISGVHDLERVMGLARHFNVPGAVVVNKADLNESYGVKIKEICEERGIDFLGSIPYEPRITEAQRQGKTILESEPDCSASRRINQILERLIERMEAL